MKTKFFVMLLTAILLIGAVSLPVSTQSIAPSYITVAQPRTNVLGDIAIVREINTAEEYQALVEAENKPAAAILHLNESLAFVGDGNAAIGSLAGFLSDTAYSVLPALVIKDEAAADALIAFTRSTGFCDLLFLTDSTALLKTLKTAIPAAIGVLDASAVASSAMTKDDCSALRKELWTCGGTIAYLPSSAISPELIRYLYARQVSIWLDADGITDIGSLTTLLLSGAVGIVSDASDALLDIAVNKLPLRSIARPTVLIGHRGSAAAPENTIEGAFYAYENGAAAVEIDIMLTADGVPVVIHDTWTGRTCGTSIEVNASTLEQIKSLYANAGFENDPLYAECRIPTFEEFLLAFSDKDCILVVEIKTADPAIVPIVKELIEEKDMYDRCNVICFYPDQLRLFRESYPEMPVGLLCENIMGSVYSELAFRDVMAMTGALPSTYNPSYNGIDSNDMRAATHRGHGLYIWTIGGGKSQYYDPLRNGITGLTGNNVEYVNGVIVSIAPETPLEPTYGVGDVLSPSLSATDYLERCATVTEENKKYIDILILEGEDCVSFSEDGLVFTKEGTVIFSFVLKQHFGISPYHIISEPQTVTVTSRPSVSFTVLFLIGLALLLILSAIPITIVLRKQKKAES